MQASHLEAETFLEELRTDTQFAELFDYYLCKQDILQSHLAERIFVEPATISHWRRNRRMPDNLGILHRVCQALQLSPPEQKNLIIAWCNTRTMRDLIPFIAQAMDMGDVEHALQVARLIIGSRPFASLGLENPRFSVGPTSAPAGEPSSLIRVGESQAFQTRRFMEIKLASIMVNDQDKALRFYTEKLGFVKKNDAPDGPFRFLTVVSEEGADGVELVLEGLDFPHSAVFQKANYDAGIPSYAFYTKNIHAEYNRLKAEGVVFRGEPEDMGPVTRVLFEDTCGNIINLV
jgi:catechol 2,3-dioxygenase-like lactoylglutathione lyase family enzyme